MPSGRRARFWKETERNAYRLQREFRELWPEFETPNELAGRLLGEGNLVLEKDKKGNVSPFSVSAQVTV